MMTQSPLPIVQDVVLIGGGHSHGLFLRMWGMNPLAGVRVTVINPNPVAPYTGMLPGAIAGHYSASDLMIDLVRLGRFAGARVLLDRAIGLDPARRVIKLASGREVGFDLASIDIGITSDLPDLAGAGDFATSAKPLGDYARRWEAFVQAAPTAPSLTVIGGGVGGVELALASAHRMRSTGRAPRVTLLERGATILPAIGSAARRALLAELARAGITVRTEAQVAEVAPDRIWLTSGEELPSDFTLTVAGSRPQAWLAKTGLQLHAGFIAVNPQLQTSDPAIFATGDCAHLTQAPRPKAGVFAVRQAPVLLHNIRATLTGGELRAYHPQRDYLKLISLGDRRALADKFGLRLGGAWLWRVKDRIDRSFMEKFADYPAMPAPALPRPTVIGLAAAMGDKPMCGGCGAKVDQTVLTDVLATLPPPRRDDLLTGAGDDAAVLAFGKVRQVITTDHLRAFTCDPALMGRLAAIHALGDIWAMAAAPQAALAQITLPRASATVLSRILSDVMGEAARVFRAAGAEVAGGHSSLGDELTVGFTVTGLTTRPLMARGAAAGDRLLLTKPIGTGVILAAEMAATRISNAKAQLFGQVWADAITSMARPMGFASAILSRDATAMTDVTGFGLLGHLWGMLGQGALSARLDLHAVPMLEGAVDLAAQGIASTLQPANRAALDWQVDGEMGPRAELLFDPQTCGGLLAAIPADKLAEILAAMHAAEEPVWVIGEVTAPAPGARGRIMLRND